MALNRPRGGHRRGGPPPFQYGRMAAGRLAFTLRAPPRLEADEDEARCGQQRPLRVHLVESGKILLLVCYCGCWLLSVLLLLSSLLLLVVVVVVGCCF